MQNQARAWRRRALEVATGITTWLWISAMPARACAADLVVAPVADRGTVTSATRWLAFGVLGGATAWDPRLDDYQWSVGPRAAWGVQAQAGTGPYAAGVRLWRAQSRQQIDPGSSSDATTVHSTSLELVGRRRVAGYWNAALSAGVSAGLLRFDYAPDRVQVATGTGTVDVEFRPIDTWVAGFGLAIERPLPGSWFAGFAVDQRWFGLEAAHRNGNQIEIGRERFVDWSARLELSRLWGRR